MDNIGFLDILTILSFVIALENLSLNEEQVTRLHEHLSEQDDHLEKQDKEMLEKIIENQGAILRALEEIRS